MKVHLLSVDSPRPISGTLAADCGKEVKDAAEGGFCDFQMMGVRMEIPKNCCKACVKEAKSERYTYAICEARELKREEDLYV